MLDQEIAAAVDAHMQWKVRLRTAIETGKLDAPIETIRSDRECRFGKWLHGSTIPAAAKQGTEYRDVVGAHADFHRVAASVAGLAGAGRQDEARKALGYEGVFWAASQALLRKLDGWKAKKPA